MRPPNAWTFWRTTSIPTPRPEMFDTSRAVEKPGAKISWSISSSDRRASAGTMPRSAAIASTRSRSMPAPSSLTEITMRLPLCSADRRRRPSAGLPFASRSAGSSMPWSTQLRTRWVSGSPIRSITVLSSSVASPSTSIWTRLPVDASSSRTMRGTRLNTDFTGCARIAIALSCSSRVSWSRSASSSTAARPLETSRCDSIDWVMTSSPTRSTSRSSFSRSTRIVAPAATLAGFAAGGTGTAGGSATVGAAGRDAGTGSKGSSNAARSIVTDAGSATKSNTSSILARSAAAGRRSVQPI